MAVIISWNGSLRYKLLNSFGSFSVLRSPNNVIQKILKTINSTHTKTDNTSPTMVSTIPGNTKSFQTFSGLGPLKSVLSTAKCPTFRSRWTISPICGNSPSPIYVRNMPGRWSHFELCGTLIRRHSGLVVCIWALDFRSGGRWPEPGLCRRVVSLDKKLYSTLSLFTQVYKWVPVIIRLGGGGGLPCDGLASYPGVGGSSNIPSRFMLQKPELSAGMMGHLVRKPALP